ncbi:MAG: AAA family ATPase [Bacteroidia bacterium]|nr:AAA family ATPase [Bacteroidia bacterium]
MKIPYGISNFKALITQGYYYVDRTPYIEYLENLGEKYLFFLRPRRFGKSLFVSMLSYYYDSTEKENFQTIYGKYHIGQNPTPLANQYGVLEFEFSRINTTTAETTLNGFLSNTKIGAQNFFQKYPLISQAQQEKILSQNEPAEVLKALLTAYKNKLIIYVLIDEYDHFANELMAFNLDNFRNIVSRNGFVRKFYEALKTGTLEGVVDRMFITGVTPITLDAFTSGFNIGVNLSLEAQLNALMGFTEAEVETLLAQLGPDVPVRQIMPDIREWYDGYRFARSAKQRIYNADMVLYFAKEYQRHREYPERMLDVNIASDYGKLRRLFALRNPKQNFKVLEDLVQQPFVPANITAQFSFEKEFSRDDFLSLLYYMGFVTYYDQTPFHSFRVPNEVIRSLYLEYFIHLLKEREGLSFSEEAVKEAILQMGFYDNAEPYFRILEEILKELSDRDFQNFNEKNIKLLIFATAALSNHYFHLKSEREGKDGYTDILFLEKKPYQVYHQYAIELKYLKKEEASRLEEVQAQAARQLQNYIREEPTLRELTNLKAFTIIVVKDDLHLREIAIH